MRKVAKAHDASGRAVNVGDTVSTINGDFTGKISDIREDGEAEFVCVKPLYRAYGRGEWHASDRVVWLATARKKIVPAPKPVHNRASGHAGSGHAQTRSAPQNKLATRRKGRGR
jgi:hypothetical protein